MTTTASAPTLRAPPAGRSHFFAAVKPDCPATVRRDFKRLILRLRSESKLEVISSKTVQFVATTSGSKSNSRYETSALRLYAGTIPSYRWRTPRDLWGFYEGHGVTSGNKSETFNCLDVTTFYLLCGSLAARRELTTFMRRSRANADFKHYTGHPYQNVHATRGVEINQRVYSIMFSCR